ncbi:unnamed protein product [Cylicocyclus nassatus]|uniref:Uncharacterized protein n=1 Tax=Cylicocyclus nassatus TaxID=53992 RepID=A0AA36M750_CYLNA|nr:unnamed protein product [Cylicocyclus nassatus]
MKAIFVLLALVISVCFARKCTTTTDCGSAMMTCVDGNCFRIACPKYSPPILKPGCKLKVVDKEGCPILKQIC